MQIVLRLDEQTAAGIVNQRDVKAITDMSKFSRETSIQMRPGYATLVPSRHFRLSLWNKEWNKDTHLNYEDSLNEDAQYWDTQYEDTNLLYEDTQYGDTHLQNDQNEDETYGDTHPQNEEPWNLQLEDTHLKYEGTNQTWIGISLTPNSPLAPWEIGYRMKVEPSGGLENPSEDPYESDFAGFGADDFARNFNVMNAEYDEIARAGYGEIAQDGTEATVARNQKIVGIDPPSPLLRQWLPEE